MTLNYDFRESVSKLVREIIENNYHSVLLQLPDGFKQYGSEIQKMILQKLKEENYSDIELFFYMNSNFGACDLPSLDFDLIVNFGHSEYFNRSQNNDVQARQK